MKIADDFIKIVEKNNINRWNIHQCTFCGYQCGFIFYEGLVYYDNGCDCNTYYREPLPRTYQDVADHYNLQTHPGTLQEYNKFWGFKD